MLRVAVVQMNLPAGQRSRTLSLVAEAIDAAAREVSAPDLIVLPECYDTALLAAEVRLMTPAMCQGFVEAVARRAREWGVWIAVGHVHSVEEHPQAAASLLDPDGDPWIHFPQHCEPFAGDRENTTAEWSVAPTPIGRIVLRPGSLMAENTLRRPQADQHADLLLVPSTASAADSVRRTAATTATALGAYACVSTGVAQTGKTGQSSAGGYVLDPQNRIVQETGPNQRIRVVELPIEPRYEPNWPPANATGISEEHPYRD